MKTQEFLLRKGSKGVYEMKVLSPRRKWKSIGYENTFSYSTVAVSMEEINLYKFVGFVNDKGEIENCL